MRLEPQLEARILIVDDHPANALLLQRVLEAEGYNFVDTTTDPRTVVGLHEINDYDLILLDLRMPYLDGFEVMRLLMATIVDDFLPVLVITAQTDEETRLKALREGARDFLTKPFGRSEILARIRNHLEVRALFNRQRVLSETLEARVHERTQALLDSQYETIRRLGRAGELRDNETGLHVVRMSHTCHRLALASGLGEERAKLLRDASPMHDIGKIGIPDRILLKPGSLAPDEWEIMKTHVTIGADMLAGGGSEIISCARTVVLSHHERWDGSGYPAGQRGDEIPIEGRIAALADVFDALTSERPYKSAWSVPAAIDYVHENAGRHFDPNLVAVFDEVLPDILDIREQFADEPDNYALRVAAV